VEQNGQRYDTRDQEEYEEEEEFYDNINERVDEDYRKKGLKDIILPEIS
jgi:acid phosphatase class B